MEKKIQIVLVDDEIDFGKVFKLELKHSKLYKHVEITFLTSADEAINYLNEVKNRYDHILVLSDINMPNKSGHELLYHLNHYFPEIPVFMVSAYDSPEHKELSFDNGAEEYFTKPLILEDLITKIEKRFIL